MKINAYEFWTRVDSLVQQKQMNLGEFSKSSSVPYNTLVTQRTRKSVPKTEQLIEMASTLGTSIDYLVTGRESLNQTHDPFRSNQHLRDLLGRIIHCNSKQVLCLHSLMDTWGVGRSPGENHPGDVALA